MNEDCTVKLCDYGLARSITGVESSEMILKKSQSNPHQVEPASIVVEQDSHMEEDGPNAVVAETPS